MSRRILDAARGRECTLRINPPCDSATVVTHHVHRRGHGIMGGKVPDIFGVHCCAACHRYVHANPRDPLVTERLLAGLIETQLRLIDAGLVRTA